MFIVGIVIFLIVLFTVLSFWQKQVDREQKEKVLTELREAKARGTNKAIAQFPHIQPTLCIGCGSCIEACPEDDVLGLVNGIAHIINASRCVGHARCQEVCPVGAIKVGLGNVSERPDIPLLSSDFETSIPGVFIAGELGGMALIRNAIAQGTHVIDVISKRLEKKKGSFQNMVDVLIVGAGPAGLAATFRAAENKLTHTTISLDDVGGTIRKYPRQKLTLVQTVTLPLHGKIDGREYAKEEIIEMWEGLLQKHRVTVKTGIGLQTIRRATDHLEVETSAGVFQCRSVVLALGRRGVPRKLNVPGEESEKVLYQLIDANTYNNKHILIVGGGDSAIEAATALANQKGNVVTISYRKESLFRLKPRNEERIKDYVANKKIRIIYSSDVKSIEQNQVTIAVKTNEKESDIRIPNNLVFVFAGGDPPFPLLKKMGIRFGGETSDPSDKMAAA